ncbi:MAG: RES family NAD+ phosphorylase [Thermoanaerobaculia bacterium]
MLSLFNSTRTTPTTHSFRGSITRPRPSLSTLRRRPHERPRKTRLRLVASLYRAGFAPAGSHLKGFRSADCCLHRFLLPQAYPGAPNSLSLDRWLQQSRSLALCVPSAVVPSSTNVLINPLHRDAGNLEIVSREPFGFDSRLRL